jgi:hypothetical protein
MLSVLLFFGGHWSPLVGQTGALTQLSGLSGCVSNSGTSGACVQSSGLVGAAFVEISRGGNYLYVASPLSSTVTTFSRNPSPLCRQFNFRIEHIASGESGCEHGDSTSHHHGVDLITEPGKCRTVRWFHGHRHSRYCGDSFRYR